MAKYVDVTFRKPDASIFTKRLYGPDPMFWAAQYHNNHRELAVLKQSSRASSS